MTAEEIRKFFENNRFTLLCGIELTEKEDGSLMGRAEVMPQYLNASGHIHGGFMYTMADSVGGANARLYAREVVTLDSDLHFLVNKSTRYLYAEARVLRNGSSIVVLSIQITGDEGDVYAEGTFTFYKFN